MAHVVDGVGDLLGLDQLVALLVDHLALVVHDVVVLQQILANLEVARLDLLLRLLERLVDPRMDDRLVLLQPQLAEHAVHALGAEDAHQVVLEREVELGAARVALAAGAAAQLVVDAARLVALGAEHVQPARGDHLLLLGGHLLVDPGRARRPLGLVLDLGQLLELAHVGIAAELDVGAAPGHVGGDGDAAEAPGLGDDVRLLLVIAGVQHVVRDLRLLEQARRGARTSRC